MIDHSERVDRLRAWGENDPNHEYFQVDVLSIVLRECGEAGEVIAQLVRERDAALTVMEMCATSGAFHARRAEVAEARSEQPADFVAFAREITQACGDGGDFEGGDIQGIALRHGVLRQMPYDPAVHGRHEEFGVEPGDPWFEFAAPASARGSTAAENRAHRFKVAPIDERGYVDMGKVERLRVIRDPSLVGEVVDRNPVSITIAVHGIDLVTRTPDAFEPAPDEAPTMADEMEKMLRRLLDHHGDHIFAMPGAFGVGDLDAARALLAEAEAARLSMSGGLS